VQRRPPRRQPLSGSVISARPGVREARTCAAMEEVRNTSLLPV
jgi:hypothetical protein